jgi:ADP-ribose pyrophosphatase YjhB (NUDIX family)
MENKAWVMPTHIIAAAGVVINENGEILLVKHHRDGWVFPGGQVEEGENVIETVKREVMEEAGVEVDVGELFCISSNTGREPGYNGVKEIPTKLMLDFICRAKSGVPRPSNENAESGYFPAAQVMDLMTAPAMTERYKAYLEYAGRPTYLEYVKRPEFRLKLKKQI